MHYIIGAPIMAWPLSRGKLPANGWGIRVVVGLILIIVLLTGCAATPSTPAPTAATAASPAVENPPSQANATALPSDPASTATPALPSNPAPTDPAPTVTTESTLRWQQLPTQEIDGRIFRQYAIVSRSDGTYRTMYIDETTLQAWASGAALPAGALFVMETYYTPNNESTNFIKLLEADGSFNYGSFSPSRPLFATREDNSCTSCHNGSVDPAGTYTLPMLEAAVAQGVVLTTLCDQSGRTPCDAQTYQQFTPQSQAPAITCRLCHASRAQAGTT